MDGWIGRFFLDAQIKTSPNRLKDCETCVEANWEVGHTQKISIWDFPAFRKKRTGE